MVEFERVQEKARIRASTEKGFGRVLRMIVSRRVRTMVEVRPIPEKGSIRVNTEKGFGRVSRKVVSKRGPENGRIQANIGEW